MKKTLCLILAALLLASSVVSCGKTEPAETKVSETNAPETSVPETDPVETEATAADSSETEASAPSYDTSLVTENGVAKAHIVIPEGGEQLLTYAAEELAYHIKKVSGAEVTVTNAVEEGSLPILIGTPDSLSELETLFPEDIAWLRETGNPGDTERWGDDGFAIRQHDNKIYIFGTTARGSLNGTYDFIEENMGVLWTRADESLGLVYDEMPTVTVRKMDYREKSPFALRTWTYENFMIGNEAEILLSRNKLNAVPIRPYQVNESYPYDDIGLKPFVTNHNIKWWIINSPTYDPNCREYWSTDEDGNHAASASDSAQVNFWSDVTVDVIADHVIAFLDQYGEKADLEYIGICLEDWEEPSVVPEQNMPYEYAPGQFVEPNDSDYNTTVFYSFMNKVAAQVAEKYPEIIIHTYAYTFTEKPPRCEIEDNLYITFCSYFEDLCFPLDEPKNSFAVDLWDHLQGWGEKTKNISFYNYYGCFSVSPVFERPIWSRMQADFRYYAANGYHGMASEGVADVPGYDFRMSETPEGEYEYTDVWEMNTLTFWLYSKLAWNPEEDIDALIDDFCQKCYGGAAEHMREYYRLLELGWTDGAETYGAQFNALMKFYAEPWEYYYNFLDTEVDGIHILEGIREALSKAWDAADDTVKARIAQAKESFENWEDFVG